MSDDPTPALDPDEAAEWDDRYSTENDGAPMWSGEPNGSLVVEISDVPVGSVLDVGCGEGADAVWLARQGWSVTALDPSRVAITRGEEAAAAAGVAVRWVHGGLQQAAGDDLGTFDLVSAQYPAVRKTDGTAVAALLSSVARRGTLLFVHHDLDAHRHVHGDGSGSGSGRGATAHAEDGDGDDHDHDWDPADYVLPSDVRAALDDGWQIEVDEVRDRPGPLPEDARHVRDTVLRARRLT